MTIERGEGNLLTVDDVVARVLRLDPSHPLSIRADLAAVEDGKTWREMEGEA